MAESLGHDHDLRFEAADRARAAARDPRARATVRLMSADGWSQAYFGQTWPYAALAAPVVLAGGARALLSLNLALVALLVGLGFLELRRHDRPGPALLLSAGFFLLGGAPVAAWRIGPALLDMAAVALALGLGLGPAATGVRAATARAAAAGAAIALAIYDLPLAAVLLVPLLVAYAARRGRRELASFVAAVPLTLAVLAGISATLTPAAWPHFAIERRDLPVRSALPEPRAPLPEAAAVSFPVPGAWSALPRPPALDGRRLAEDARDFLIERHAGILLHHAPLAIALLLFLIHSGRSAARWSLVLALAAAGLLLLVWLPEGWEGNLAVAGNPLLLPLYPAFVFLPTGFRPRPLVAATGLLAALLAAPSLATVFASRGVVAGDYPVAELWPLRHLPVTPRIALRSPAYRCDGSFGLRLCGKPEPFRGGDPELDFAAGRTELWVVSPVAIERPVFRLAGLETGETALVVFEGRRRRFSTERPEREVSPRRQPLRRARGGGHEHVYRLAVTAPRPVRLSYLRSRAEREADLFAVGWLPCKVPGEVRAGREFDLLARFINRSSLTWPSRGAVAVRFSYHWLDAAGEPAIFDGQRTELAYDLEPGGVLTVPVSVLAPPGPGRYSLVLDLVYDGVSWFSHRDPGNARAFAVEVLPAGQG